MTSLLTSAVKRTIKASGGELRYNTNTNEMEAYNGANWIPVTESFKYRLEISSGTIYGADYYTIAPINAENQWDKMMSWMVTTFGPTTDDGAWTPNQRWYANNAKFWFKNKKDLDWFILRWSS